MGYCLIFYGHAFLADHTSVFTEFEVQYSVISRESCVILLTKNAEKSLLVVNDAFDTGEIHQ